jgi:hypothetical protein
MAVKRLAVWAAQPYQGGRLFDPASPLNRDNCLAPFHVLKARLEKSGWECRTQDVYKTGKEIPDAVLFSDLPSAPLSSALGNWEGKTRNFLIINECEVIRPDNWDIRNHEGFEAIFTWSPWLVDGRKYFKLNFSMAFPSSGAASPSERPGFCAMIAGNKKKTHPLELYSEREKTIRWFEREHPGEFDLYGAGWDRKNFGGPRLVRALNRIGPLTRLLAPRFPSYKGRVDQKLPVLGRYKFAICYENAREIPGYITEKIFDCLFAGCVPVYWGAPDITEYVPLECFVDRRAFKSHEELYSFLKAMPKAELASRRAAIAAYLSGGKVRPFTADHFAETIAGRILNG